MSRVFVPKVILPYQKRLYCGCENNCCCYFIIHQKIYIFTLCLKKSSFIKIKLNSEHYIIEGIHEIDEDDKNN